ncbi:MAG: iron-sulfur cluster carrier protein [Candidatus Mesenet longicola]|uniref:Iron-sulfur cluster carrier protein n=1 Tax=Candidatus Mesenet longicola TaxID=1892558 RepID=A0A8J3MMV1_9RICK|nr:MAG: iron-sulfur cluster carrier protein [Candidatus Mesenet longicola]GHM59552.1 MAG: iron-sulfur cluster carrier protein [Candidatus Mesenet longicola]
MVNEEEIKLSLRKVIDQDIGKDVVTLDMVSSIVIKEGHVGFVLQFLNREHAVKKANLKIECENVLKAVPDITKVTVVEAIVGTTSQKINNKISIEGVKNTIVVVSGKGGVGKSTVALNIAVSLLKLGYRSAIADVDIYGPSLPQMLGSQDLTPQIENKKMLPVERYGLQTMSIGYVIDKNRAVIWRGPMVTKALHNLLLGTKWQDVEYLIIDTPPGTGDVHLSLAEKFNLTGAIIVSTPQELALIDAKKAFDMLKKLNVPIIGIVENMSYFSYQGLQIHIFGENGAEKMAKELNIKFLGKIPLDPQICKESDSGLLPEALMKVYSDITEQILMKD